MLRLFAFTRHKRRMVTKDLVIGLGAKWKLFVKSCLVVRMIVLQGGVD